MLIMNNFEFEHNGKKLWYSRSLAVSLLAHSVFDGKIRILANKRGEGAEFNKHLWNLPGGFVDFNETAEEAACRETLEETGYIINPRDISLVDLDTNPKNSWRQTMVAKFNVALEYTPEHDGNFRLTNTNGEVEDVEWIALDELDNYNWVRGQKEYIKEYFNILEK
jgi:8-oxo-dGTP pyrophosphatase MutT (NUDIX family)